MKELDLKNKYAFKCHPSVNFLGNNFRISNTFDVKQSYFDKKTQIAIFASSII